MIDARIFHIWELFQRLNDNSSRHSSSDVRLLTPLFGEAAIPHIRDAFIAYWRLGEPLLRGERSVEGRNTGNAMEMIGLVGIAMEAAKNIDWARKLSNQDATKAATYGTLELNGFPEWFAELCLKKPLICADVLRRDLAHELTSTSPETRYGLDRLARAEDQIAQTLAEDMLKLIESEASSELPTEVLEPVLKIALRSDEKEKFLHVLLSRAHAAHTPDKIAKYLTAAFAIDSKTSTQALLEIEKTLSEHDAVQLALQVLPPIMGTAWAMEKHDIADFEAEDLEKLIVFAYDRIQPATDLDHTGGKVYSPGLRDHAQDARNGAIQKLARMPGAATARALNQLMNLPSPPIPKENLAKLIVSHAQSDAESAAWTSTDVVGFENDFTTVPRTPADLQRVAASRIEDLKHHLSDSDYGRASAVAMLPREVDVQNWMANELEKKQGRSFTLEREGHVADEKEPDIRLTASGTSARLPIEIKVAESWTLKELDKALTEQLMGRYLRAHNARWGILLVVHQKARPEGWEDTEAGKFLTFPEVIKRLQAKALAISASDATAAQMQVCVIDVSMAPIDAPKRKPAPKKSTSSTHKPPTDGQET